MTSQSWLCTNRSGLPLALLRVAGRKLIHGPHVPLTDPIRDPVSRERGALRDHPVQVLYRPALVIIHERVGFAIPIDIGDRVRIIGAHRGSSDSPGRKEALSLLYIDTFLRSYSCYYVES
jgi:hypothetical protein